MNWKNYTYHFSIALFTIGVCCSKFFMSMGLLVGGIYFLFLGDYKEKLKNLKSNPIFLLLFSFYLLHIIGILWSSDISDGLNEIRQKSTLAIIPIILFSSVHHSKKSFNWVKIIFLSTLFLTSLINFIGYHLYFEELGLKETRNMSLFIGHIRYALVIALAAVWCFYEFTLKSTFSNSYFILFCWFSFYTIQSQVLSGILGIGLGLLFLSIWILIKKRKWFYLITFSSLGLFAMLSIIYYLSLPIRIPSEVIAMNSQNKLAWESKSNVSLDGNDIKGQPIQFTLNRYLFSLDLPLNSDGIDKLSSKDIQNIENGVADIHEVEWPFLSRLYEIRYEIQVETDPNLHPILERLELWDNCLHTINKYWVFGVGTGGIKNVLDKSYEERNSPLEKTRRLKPHNTYLTYWLTFGIFGILFIIFLLSYFGLIAIKANFPLGVIFILIVSSSFLSEDTLDSQAGITFFTFFFSLFGLEIYRKIIEKK